MQDDNVLFDHGIEYQIRISRERKHAHAGMICRSTEAWEADEMIERRCDMGSDVVLTDGAALDEIVPDVRQS